MREKELQYRKELREANKINEEYHDRIVALGAILRGLLKNGTIKVAKIEYECYMSYLKLCEYVDKSRENGENKIITTNLLVKKIWKSKSLFEVQYILTNLESFGLIELKKVNMYFEIYIKGKTPFQT